MSTLVNQKSTQSKDIMEIAKIGLVVEEIRGTSNPEQFQLTLMQVKKRGGGNEILNLLQGGTDETIARAWRPAKKEMIDALKIKEGELFPEVNGCKMVLVTQEVCVGEKLLDGSIFQIQTWTDKTTGEERTTSPKLTPDQKFKFQTAEGKDIFRVQVPMLIEKGKDAPEDIFMSGVKVAVVSEDRIFETVELDD